MELLVLHSAGASEEQDRLHRSWELRGSDDKGTCPFWAALLHPACPRGTFENSGLAKKKTSKFWEGTFGKYLRKSLFHSFLSWLTPLCNLSQQRAVYLMFCAVDRRIVPGSTDCDCKVISRQKGKARKFTKKPSEPGPRLGGKKVKWVGGGKCAKMQISLWEFLQSLSIGRPPWKSHWVFCFLLTLSHSPRSPSQNKNLDWFPRMRAMSLVSNEGEGEQNEIRNLQDKLNSTMKLVSHLTSQLNELKEQVLNIIKNRNAWVTPHCTKKPSVLTKIDTHSKSRRQNQPIPI